MKTKIKNLSNSVQQTLKKTLIWFLIEHEIGSLIVLVCSCYLFLLFTIMTLIQLILN